MVWQHLQTGRKQDWQVERCRAQLLLLLSWPAALCHCDGHHRTVRLWVLCRIWCKIPQNASASEGGCWCVHACMHACQEWLLVCSICMQWASLIHISAHMERWYLLFILCLIKGWIPLSYCNIMAYTLVDRLNKAWTSTILPIQVLCVINEAPWVCLCMSMKVHANTCSCVWPCCKSACMQSGCKHHLCMWVSCICECVYSGFQDDCLSIHKEIVCFSKDEPHYTHQLLVNETLSVCVCLCVCILHIGVYCYLYIFAHVYTCVCDGCF